MVQIIRRTGSSPKKNIFDYSIDPIEYSSQPVDKVIATWDTETDPFMHGRAPKPFTCGFYIPSIDFYIDFWGDDCIAQYIHWLDKATGKGGQFEGWEFVILCHNFGNFDFFFIPYYTDPEQKPFIINGRIVKIIVHGQEYRDSYSMIPVPLAAYDKDAIDYRCMERGFREVFKPEILKYQKKDCTALAELVTNWYDMFGNKLTMAGVALPMLRSFHGFDTISETDDFDLRPYYFGGRNQCFATGVIEGDFHVYDINSSYPDVMRRYNHPISETPHFENKISDRTHFAHIRAWSLGALPIRNPNGSLAFPVGTFDFYACIHEIKAGLETKTLKILKVYSSIYFETETTFEDFIDTYYEMRLDAAAQGDEIRKLFYKLVMNSSYGKFAQDPRRYENWLFDPESIPTPVYCHKCYSLIRDRRFREEEKCDDCKGGKTDPYGWYLHTERQNRFIYAQPQRVTNRSFFNVATAASITSAARASLLYGIQAATRPLYCDTDSIICERLDEQYGVRIHEKELGAWKSEAQGTTVCIAGKKLYAIYYNEECIKKASKGVRLSADEIRRVSQGETVEYANPVPKFKLNGDTVFQTRKIKRTVL